MPLAIIRNDITKMQVDAIVNAANTSLQEGGGVCGAIFYAAGAEKLQRDCDKQAPIETGEAVITKGYDLPAKYIIHAAGPIYRGGGHDEESQLRSCYINSLELAKKHQCNSIAFPLISSGIYGYPKEGALNVATNAIRDWLMENDMEVSLVVFDKAAFSVSQDLLGDVKAYINEHYVNEANMVYSFDRSMLLPEKESFLLDEPNETKEQKIKTLEHLPPPPMQEMAQQRFKEPQPTKKSKHGDVMGMLDEPFSATLFKLIDSKGKTDVEIYKRANLDRKLFSKIRTGKGYMPSKKTVAALAVALELTLAETRDLMGRAGFALSRSVVFDVIIEYFISQCKYDIYEINNVLFEYDQPILGG